MIIPIDTQGALKHFSNVDPIMFNLLKCSLEARPPLTLPEATQPHEYFGRVVRSIVSQQISVKAAASVFARVCDLVGEVNPSTVLLVPEADLKACGLSGQKTKYIRHNANLWHELPIESFQTMSDANIIAELIKLYGIGTWTAEMFLLFSLARPNVFSYGDLALMQGIYKHYQVKPHHVRKIATLVDNWSPHGSLASLCLWRHKDTTSL